MRQFDCPFCGAPIALEFWQCAPHFVRPDATCTYCAKQSYFLPPVKLLSYFLGLAAMFVVFALSVLYLPLPPIHRLILGILLGTFPYSWVSEAICYWSAELDKTP